MAHGGSVALAEPTHVRGGDEHHENTMGQRRGGTWFAVSGRVPERAVGIRSTAA